MKSWDELKAEGSAHYKTGGIEPIDLYRDLGIFRDFALCSIMKYAARNANSDGGPVKNRDMRKIIHYAELLMAGWGDDNT